MFLVILKCTFKFSVYCVWIIKACIKSVYCNHNQIIFADEKWDYYAIILKILLPNMSYSSTTKAL